MRADRLQVTVQTGKEFRTPFGVSERLEIWIRHQVLSRRLRRQHRFEPSSLGSR